MNNSIYYIPVFELPLFVLLVLSRAIILRRQGIKALVFGATDKSDFLLIPFIAFFFYALMAGIFNFPFPEFPVKSFWTASFFPSGLPVILLWTAIVLCTASLIWFAFTLKVFGKSFRVGIDENTKEKLITKGPFALSRNPVYTAFIVFFTGIFLAYSGIITAIFLFLLIITIHRQVLREEKFLKSHYGKEYNDYCKKTRRYF